jgi:hypothetical protein
MDTGEITKETVKTIAQGMPVLRLSPVATLLVCFFNLHARPWVAAEAPGIPCALCFFEGHRENSGAGRVAGYGRVPRTQRGVKRCAADPGSMILLGAG